jgi:hypothetical protein
VTRRKYSKPQNKPDIEGARTEARRLLIAGSWALRSDDKIEAAVTVNPLRQLAQHRIERLPDSVIPKDEREFILKALTQYEPLRKPGGQTYKRSDRLLVEVIDEMRRFGLSPTRNRASKHECGTSIVAQVLNKLGHPLGEKRLANIWAAHRRTALRPPPEPVEEEEEEEARRRSRSQD